MEERFCGSTGVGREWKCCLLNGRQWHIDVSTPGDSSVPPYEPVCSPRSRHCGNKRTMPDILLRVDPSLVPSQEDRSKQHRFENFPGGPVVKMLCFPWRGHGFNPWSGN